MTQGRKKNPITPATEANIDNDAVASASAAALALAPQLNEIDALYGDGTPYHMETSIQKAIFYLNESADAMLKAGKQLILLKEHEPHGDFMHALERIGMAPRAAQKMMQATVKFTKPNAPTLAHLGKSKLLELMVEDDEDLAELGKGGTLAGLALDEIDKMSVRELRDSIRKERVDHKKELAAQEHVNEKKEKMLNEFEKKLFKRQEDLPIIVRSIREDCVLLSGSVIIAINKMHELRQQILDVDLGKFNEDDRVIGLMAVTYLQFCWQMQAYLIELITEADKNFQGYLDQENLYLAGVPGSDLDPEEVQKIINMSADMARRMIGLPTGNEDEEKDKD